ncbi:Autoinducer 2 import ATP-binding protein LsrA [Bacillus rhizoplanae]|uniref:Autoinducer 2 import ATP-binding protein LsrA n=1 Tax=Bacillus rhizoplanae TaxID=2880966 RepID=A0ABM8YFA0_9BACI|nr:sugar ABC transporter ATP-binding protein [Bacillus rhizoplanae]CAG9614526.1 Autoinducer 2 import ATP-binding protein LsrA [Bacillus rhizoplanae]
MEQVPLLEVKNVKKAFLQQPVLKGIDLTVKKGDIFALVGGNGAGKSTLMKILTGLYTYDEGEMKIKGRSVTFSNPSEAHRNGIYLVPQEPLIFPNMTIEENILLGMRQKKRELRTKLDVLMRQLGWNLKLGERASLLSIAQQQLVEIVRGLIREAEILILDEPTSTLTANEIKSLFVVMKNLKEQGIGMIYITHRFPEIFAIADQVAILRDGVISNQGTVNEFTYDILLQGLLPEDYQQIQKRESLYNETASLKQVLQVNHLFSHRFRDVSLEVKAGEIVGIAGVVGAGRTELAEVLYGITSATEGNVLLDGNEITTWSTKKRIEAGIIYVPEDRAGHGIFSIASIQQNMTSVLLYRLSTFFLNQEKESALTIEYIKNFQIMVQDISQSIESLSGGNQQKVVLGKYLACEPKLIILDEPTRGIDAKARLEIYETIKELRENGLAVLLISSDLEEIMNLANRVYVMRNGNIVSHLEQEDISLDRITRSAYWGEEVSNG